jgi:hypothetical protein
MDTKELSPPVKATEEQGTHASEQAELESLKVDLQRLRQDLSTVELRNDDLESQVMRLGTKLKKERRAREASEIKLNETIDRLWSSVDVLMAVPKPAQTRAEIDPDSSDDELRYRPQSSRPLYLDDFEDSRLLRPRASDEAIGAAGIYQK